MATVQMHLHLSEEASRILDKYCTKRTRGAFLTDLVLAYERKNDLEGFVEGLRREAEDASRRASQAASALQKAQQVASGTNGKSKNRR
jgi:anthranilate phosphoribosyltransferase